MLLQKPVCSQTDADTTHQSLCSGDSSKRERSWGSHEGMCHGCISWANPIPSTISHFRPSGCRSSVFLYHNIFFSIPHRTDDKLAFHPLELLCTVKYPYLNTWTWLSFYWKSPVLFYGQLCRLTDNKARGGGVLREVLSCSDLCQLSTSQESTQHLAGLSFPLLFYSIN